MDDKNLQKILKELEKEKKDDAEKKEVNDSLNNDVNIKDLRNSGEVNQNFILDSKELIERQKRESEKAEKIKLIDSRLGNDILKLLERKSITEVMLNQDGEIWIDEFGEGKSKTKIVFTEENAIMLMQLLATQNNTTFSEKMPIIHAILPRGERFAGTGFDISGAPTFSIRKRPERIFTLDEYLEQGIITKDQRKFLNTAILEKKNILIVGGTSSGKTTFVNACINELKDTNDRVLILEDQPELQCSVANKNFYRTNDFIKMIDLLRFCMRANPDRIIVGELRAGEETLELLKAWNSGHPGGFATIHANSAAAGLKKLKQYLGEETVSDQSEVIEEGINIIVTLVKDKDTNKRVVKEIKELIRYDENSKKFILKDVI